MVDRGFIGARTAVLALRDGGRIRIRPIVPEDRELIRWGFDHLSEESRYRRFMGLKRLSEHDLDYLTNLDYHDHFAWVAFSHDEPHEPGVGVARYVRSKIDPEEAEAAVAVLDDYHHRGIGTLLLEALAAVALENGIRRFTGYLLVENKPMKDLLHTLGARLHNDSPGVERMTLELPNNWTSCAARRCTAFCARWRAARLHRRAGRSPCAGCRVDNRGSLGSNLWETFRERGGSPWPRSKS